MVLVEVLNVPVRYNGKTYHKGQLFQVDNAHVMTSVMKLVGEVAEDQTDFFIGEPIVMSAKQLDLLSVEDLKEYAKEHNIKLGRANSKEIILGKISKTQKEVW